ANERARESARLDETRKQAEKEAQLRREELTRWEAAQKEAKAATAAQERELQSVTQKRGDEERRVAQARAHAKRLSDEIGRLAHEKESEAVKLEAERQKRSHALEQQMTAQVVRSTTKSTDLPVVKVPGRVSDVRFSEEEAGERIVVDVVGEPKY